MIVDLYLVYQFIRRLATPFTEWDAYKLGIIDAEGNQLKKRKDLATREERKAFGIFDLMVCKMKRLLEKLPGGATRIASYAAALWLIKEWNQFSDSDSLLTESTTESDIDSSLQQFLQRYVDYTTLEESVKEKSELTELFDKKYPITWKKSEELWVGSFHDAENREVQIKIEMRPEGEWEIGFLKNGLYTATDEGDQYAILSTVIAGIAQFVKDVKPEQMTFAAEKRPRHVKTVVPPTGRQKKAKVTNTYRVSDTRQKIYTRMVQKFAQQIGYDFKIEDITWTRTFILTRKDVHEDAPINNVGGGAIAGLGVGPDGEPGLSKAAQKKQQKMSRRTFKSFRMEKSK